MPGAPYIKVTGRQSKLGESSINHSGGFLTSLEVSANLNLAWFIIFSKHRVLLIQVSRRPVAYAFERVVRLRT